MELQVPPLLSTLTMHHYRNRHLLHQPIKLLNVPTGLVGQLLMINCCVLFSFALTPLSMSPNAHTALQTLGLRLNDLQN